MLQVSQLVTKVATIKRPNNHQNGILWSDNPALTGKNPEVSEGPFMIAVVVDVDVCLDIYLCVKIQNFIR
jgi:hypothetical protein